MLNQIVDRMLDVTLKNLQPLLDALSSLDRLIQINFLAFCRPDSCNIIFVDFFAFSEVKPRNVIETLVKVLLNR